MRIITMNKTARFTALLASAVLGVTIVSGAAAAETDDKAGRYDRPQSGFSPANTMLTDATPGQAGLDPAPIADMLAAAHGGTEAAPGADHPIYAGAVTLLGHSGKVVTRDATGWALRYSDGEGTELPEADRIAMRTDTIFDMASVTKLFTSIVVMQQVEAGRVDLQTPVAQYVPEFAENGKGEITVQQLLTHTSGLPPWLPLWSQHPDPESRLHAALTAKLRNEPGSTYTYSDLNLIALGALAERVTGNSLDELVASGITGPLGMSDTGFNPDQALRHRIAATEYQQNPPRGMVHGEVHDENAWSLNGVAGHAGIFSTADDMSVLAQAMLNGGTYDGSRILSRQSVEKMITNYNEEFPGDEHGLGFELDQRWYMSGLAHPRTAGHTGYTGTSLVIDFPSRSFAILLTNRVHPSRSWSTPTPMRRAVAQGMALSLGVQPRHGPDAWFSGTADATSATLDAPVGVPDAGGRLSFDLFIDTESTDYLHLETSADGGGTWSAVPFDVRDRGQTTPTDGVYTDSGKRRWVQVRAGLDGGDQLLRWRYTTDSSYQGRGVFVDGVRAVSGGEVILDGEQHPEVFVANGWRSARR